MENYPLYPPWIKRHIVSDSPILSVDFPIDFSACHVFSRRGATNWISPKCSRATSAKEPSREPRLEHMESAGDGAELDGTEDIMGMSWTYHEKHHGNMDKHRWFHGSITPGLHPQPLRLLDSYQRFAPTALSPSPLPPAISSSRPEALNNRYCHHQTIIGSKTLLLCIIYIAKYISINAA